jgi:predicted transcriptional regulator
MSPVASDEEKKKMLELDVRRKIYEIVKKFAGCHFREIERKSGLSTGSVSYHLHYLARHGLIKEEKEGNKSHYFPVDFKSKNIKLLVLLRQKSVREILLFILTHDNCGHKEIVQSVGLSPSTVSWHLKKLEENNIVKFTKHGRKTSYHIVIDEEEIIYLLITYKKSFLDTMVDRVIEMWEID